MTYPSLQSSKSYRSLNKAKYLSVNLSVNSKFIEMLMHLKRGRVNKRDISPTRILKQEKHDPGNPWEKQGLSVGALDLQ